MQGYRCPFKEPTHLNLGSIGTGAIVTILSDDNVGVAMRQKTAWHARLDQQTRDSKLHLKLGSDKAGSRALWFPKPGGQLLYCYSR